MIEIGEKHVPKEKVVYTAILRKLSSEINRYRDSKDQLENKLFPEDRFSQEYIEMIAIGIEEFLETYYRALPDCQELMNNSSIMLSFAGLYPEKGVFHIPKFDSDYDYLGSTARGLGFEDLDLFMAAVDELSQLVAESDSMSFVNIDFDGEEHNFSHYVLLNSKAIYHLVKTHPDIFSIPSELNEHETLQYIFENKDDYLVGFPADFSKESYIREIRYGLLSGYELRACELFASWSLFESFGQDIEALETIDPEILRNKNSGEVVSTPDNHKHMQKRVGNGYRLLSEESVFSQYEWYAIVKVIRQLMQNFEEES